MLAVRLLLAWLTLGLPAQAADVFGIVSNAQGGEPLAKMEVALLRTSMTTVTGPDGRFRFSHLPTGSYVLQVSGVGYRSFKVSFQVESPEEANKFAISLVPENFRRTERIEVSSQTVDPRPDSAISHFLPPTCYWR